MRFQFLIIQGFQKYKTRLIFWFLQLTFFRCSNKQLFIMSQLVKSQDICANNDQINQSNSLITSKLICNGNSILNPSTDSLNLIVKHPSEAQTNLKLTVSSRLTEVIEIAQTLDEKHSVQTTITKIAKYVMTTSDSITHQILMKKIPRMKNYYRALFDKLPSQKINELFSNLKIFQHIIESTYQIAWEEEINTNLKKEILDYAEEKKQGFERVAILLVYLPEDNSIRQVIFKKLQSYLTLQLLKNKFLQNLIQLGYRQRTKWEIQSLNPESSDLEDSQDDRTSNKSQCTYGQQAQKQNSTAALSKCERKVQFPLINQKLSFIECVCNLIETIYRANLKMELVSSAFTKKKLLYLLNHYIEANSKETRHSLIKILLFIVKNNPLQFWKACEEQQLQNFLADVLVPPEIDLNSQQKTLQQKQQHYHHREAYQNGLQFLLQLSLVRQAKYMVMRVVEYLVQNKFGCVQIQFLTELLPRNKAITQYFGASFVSKIEQLLDSKKKQSRVLFCNIISLIKSMMQSLYNFQLQHFMKIIQKFQKKGGILKNCINGIKQFVRDKLAVVQQEELRDYFYNFFNKLEIQQ